MPGSDSPIGNLPYAERGRDAVASGQRMSRAFKSDRRKNGWSWDGHASSTKARIRKLLPDWLILIRGYRGTHGTYPNVIRPATFNEKVLHRILFDRRVILTQLTDKAAMRSYVESRLGAQILPHCYCLTTCPETIPFDQLPRRFVVKPTHGSRWVRLISDSSTLDRAALIETCAGWLNQSYFEQTREWIYKNIEPQILVEEFIDDGSGAAPSDYKLFVFDGTVEMIQVDVQRFTKHRRGLYTPAWKKLDVLLEHDGVEVPPPAHLTEMITAAQALGRGLDFVRADFYDTADRLYIGELTMTPGCGKERFYPREFDRYLGERWRLPGRRP